MNYIRRSYIKGCLGGPTPAEFEALQAERDTLKRELEEARAQLAAAAPAVRMGQWA